MKAFYAPPLWPSPTAVSVGCTLGEDRPECNRCRRACGRPVQSHLRSRGKNGRGLPHKSRGRAVGRFQFVAVTEQDAWRGQAPPTSSLTGTKLAQASGKRRQFTFAISSRNMEVTKGSSDRDAMPDDLTPVRVIRTATQLLSARLEIGQCRAMPSGSRIVSRDGLTRCQELG